MLRVWRLAVAFMEDALAGTRADCGSNEEQQGSSSAGDDRSVKRQPFAKLPPLTDLPPLHVAACTGVRPSLHLLKVRLIIICLWSPAFRSRLPSGGFSAL